MTHLLFNIGLALVWGMLTGGFAPGNLLFGFVVGYFILLASRRVVGNSIYFAKVPQVLSFLGYFVKELALANWRVAVDVLTPRLRMQSRIIAVPLEARTAGEITLLANLISLTPGTLTLDVSTDRRVLYIHAMYAADADAVRRDIKQGLERRLLALLRGEPPTGEV